MFISSCDFLVLWVVYKINDFIQGSYKFPQISVSKPQPLNTQQDENIHKIWGSNLAQNNLVHTYTHISEF